MRGFPDHADWTHGNGLAYDARDDSIIINLKHQDALFKIDRASGDIKWILGQHSDWPDELKSKLLQPKGDDFRWIFHAHNPRITSTGTIIIYDNGTFQARPFEKVLAPHEAFSRTVEYEVDEENMTVCQVWASHSEVGPDTCVTPAMGDAHSMPVTGNVFVVETRDPNEVLQWEVFGGFRVPELYPAR